MHSSTRRRLFAACSVVLASTSFSLVSASVPIFGGAIFNASSGSGFVDAHTDASPASVISNTGTAVASAVYRTPSKANGGQRPTFWTPTTWSQLPIGPTPPGGLIEGHGYAVNNSGQILYDAQSIVNGVNNGYRAARIDPDGATGLSNLGVDANGFGNSFAVAINDAGVTVGSSSKWINNSFRGNRAVRWATTGTAVTELSALSANVSTGEVSAKANDINASGLVVGDSGFFSLTTDLGIRAVRWDLAGNITALGNLGTNTTGYTVSSAIAVSNAGVVAGVSNKYDAGHTSYGTRAVRYASGSTAAVELGTLGVAGSGYSNVDVQGMNNSFIIGTSNSYAAGGTQNGVRAVYWSATGTTSPTELPSLGVNSNGSTTSVANAINASSNIVGSSVKWTGGISGSDHAVLWTTAGADAVIDLNTLLPANSDWTLTSAAGISDTGFISGNGLYDPDGAGSAAAYQRSFSMLVPQAGTYGHGDANFDTAVNFDDLIILAQNYNKSNAAKSIKVGDFNLDGQTNFDDLIVLAQHYNSAPNAMILGMDASFAANWALAQSLVPEPALLSLIAPLVAIRRRRTVTQSTRFSR